MNALLALRPAKPLGVQLRASMPVPCQRRLPEGLPLHHPFQNRTIPRLALNLPPLSKGGGLTARHKLLLCCVLLAICPPFLYYKLFCRQDGGIASRCTEPIYPHDHCKRTITPRSHQPFSKPHYPSKIANTLAFKMNAPEVLSRKKTIGSFLS